MNAKWIQTRRSMLVGLLGATVLFGSPISAEADQGKWWNPERGAKSDRGARSERGVRRSAERQEAYRPPAWRGRGAYRQGPQYSRPWQGRRVYRHRMWLRSDWGHRGRPVYGWRYYCPPSFSYRRHIVHVRPVRFFISAGAVIGGVHVRGTYSDPGDIYGCNFCDARFTSFHRYEVHVAHCSDAPRGYRVVTSDWDDGQWDDQRWEDDRGWDREDHDWEREDDD
jgi:hypothetical protein